MQLKKYNTILMISQYLETFYILHCLLTKFNKMSLGKCLLGNRVALISVLERNHLIRMSTLFFMHFSITRGAFLCASYCARYWGYRGE